MTHRTDIVTNGRKPNKRRVSEVVREVEAANKAGVQDRRPSKRRKKSMKHTFKGASASAPVAHLDFNILRDVFKHCSGTARLQFGAVCKLWKRVRDTDSVHCVESPSSLQPIINAASPYDTILLHPGLYKQRILCEVPLKFVAASHHEQGQQLSEAAQRTVPASPGQSAPDCSAASAALASPNLPSATAVGSISALSTPPLGKQHTAAPQKPRQSRTLPPPLSSDAVVLWQERPPAILSNTDACCLVGITVRVAHASHEYSSIAYGTEGRAITLRDCHVLGGTGLRVPYPCDPLRVLALSLQGCTIEGIKGGLSGVTAVAGQLSMDQCCVHDCTYGIEVGKDGHACVRDTDVCFTECALMCEGHMALTRCSIWANVSAWHGRPLVMEEDDHPAGARHTSEHACGPPSTGPDASRGSAGICNGVHADCATWQSARGVSQGVRTHAQLRLDSCSIDFERLRSSACESDLDTTRRSKNIRRLMRQMYGAPDQDYEDWQIVVLSDMDSDSSSDESASDIDAQAEEFSSGGSGSSGGSANSNDGAESASSGESSSSSDTASSDSSTGSDDHGAPGEVHDEA